MDSLNIFCVTDKPLRYLEELNLKLAGVGKRQFTQKYITCLNGKIYNVTIDLRKKSNTYLKIVSMMINSNKNKSVYIPPGCANAFLTMENNTTIHYLMTDYYKPKNYECFNYKSKEIKVKWPAKPKVISHKDKNSKNLNLNE